MMARIITLGTQNMARLLGDSLRNPSVHNNSFNIYVKAMEYLNTSISVLNLTQKDIGNMEERFANASDYLETWDDSNNIMAINAQKDFKTSCKNGGITTQHHNIKVPRPTVNTRK